MPLVQKGVLRGKWKIFGMLYGNDINIIPNQTFNQGERLWIDK